MFKHVLCLSAIIAAISAQVVRPDNFPKPGQEEFNCHENIPLESFAYYEVKAGQKCVEAIPTAQPIFTVGVPNANLADFCKPPAVDFRFCAFSDEEVNRLFAEQFPAEVANKPADFISKIKFDGVNPKLEHLVPHCILCPKQF